MKKQSALCTRNVFGLELPCVRFLYRNDRRRSLVRNIRAGRGDVRNYSQRWRSTTSALQQRQREIQRQSLCWMSSCDSRTSLLVGDRRRLAHDLPGLQCLSNVARLWAHVLCQRLVHLLQTRLFQVSRYYCHLLWFGRRAPGSTSSRFWVSCSHTHLPRSPSSYRICY